MSAPAELTAKPAPGLDAVIDSPMDTLASPLQEAPEMAMREGARAGALNLIPSAEPAVVFASMAAACVPAVCDHCVIDVLEAGLNGYRIAFPPGGTATAAQDSAMRRVANCRRTVIRFDNDSDGSTEEHRYQGTAEFFWQTRTPAPHDTVVIELLIGRAIEIVAWQRSEHRARIATSDAENLKVALRTSRQIGTALGILMSTQKLKDEQAFLLLRLASQHTHRKLRDVADDVIHTGWLDPAAWRLPSRDAGPGNGIRA